MNRSLSALPKAFVFVLTVSWAIPCIAQGRPDLVWYRGADTSAPMSIAVSAAGDIVLTSELANYNEYTIKLWRASDGMLLKSLNSLAYQPRPLIFSPDSKTFCGVFRYGDRAAIEIHSVLDLSLIRSIDFPAETLFGLDLSPDGRILAAGFVNGTIALFRFSDGAPINQWNAGHAPLYLKFSPDGNSLVSATGRNSDRLILDWSVPQGKLKWTASGPQLVDGFAPPSYALGFSIDGTYVHVGTTGAALNVCTYDALTGALRNDFSAPHASLYTSFSPATEAVLSHWARNSEHGVVVYHAETGSQIGFFQDWEGYRAGAVAASPEGAVVFDTASGIFAPNLVKRLGRLGIGLRGGSELQTSAGGLIAAESGNNHVFIRASDGTRSALLGQFYERTGTAANGNDGLVFTGNGDQFITTTGGGNPNPKLDLFDAGSLQRIRTIAVLDREPLGLSLSPDDRWIAVQEDQTRVLDLQSGAVVSTISASNPHFSPNGNYLSCLNQNEIQVYSTKSWSIVSHFAPGGVAMGPLVWTPDSARIVVPFRSSGASWDTFVIDVHTGAVVGLVPGVAGGAMDVSPDGSFFCMSDHDGFGAVPRGHGLGIYSLLDGTRVAYYDQETATGINSGNSHQLWSPRAVKYAKDGQRILYARADGSVGSFLNPFRTAIMPNKGGNTGRVTVRIVVPEVLGSIDGATVKLTAPGQPDIYGQDTVKLNDHALQTTFYLNNEPTGQRSISLLTGSNTLNFPDSFALETAIAADVKIQMLGRTLIRSGATSTFMATALNTGNTDLPPYTGSILFPKHWPQWRTEPGFENRLVGHSPTHDYITHPDEDGPIQEVSQRQIFFRSGGPEGSLQWIAPSSSDLFPIRLSTPVGENGHFIIRLSIGNEDRNRVDIFDAGIEINHDEYRDVKAVAGKGVTSVGNLGPSTLMKLLEFGWQHFHKVRVTGGSERDSHEAGFRSHEEGYKVDLSRANLPDPPLGSVKVQSRLRKTTQGIILQDDTYVSPTGAVFFNEGNHWDVDLTRQMPYGELTVSTIGHGRVRVFFGATRQDVTTWSMPFAGKQYDEEKPYYVTLSADWDAGSEFKRWEGVPPGIDPLQKVINVALWQNWSISAVYEEKEGNLPGDGGADGNGNGDGYGGNKGGAGSGGSGGGDPSRDRPGDGDEFGGTISGSIDPNELSGPSGFGSGMWLKTSELLTFAAMFENQSIATAAAAEVIVRTQLDPSVLDLTTFQLGSIILPDRTIVPEVQNLLPIGLGKFSQDYDLRPARPIILRVEVDLDLLTGVATWHFISLDPKTMALVEDPSLGFLDPGQGGSCLFSVRPKEGIPTGTVVSTFADIVFDFNDPMRTNVWSNTIDNTAPTASVQVIERTGAKSGKTLIRWTGSDVGSGLKDFTIYVSVDNGPFQPWLVNTTLSQEVYVRLADHSYRFHAVARDNVLNTSPSPPSSK